MGKKKSNNREPEIRVDKTIRAFEVQVVDENNANLGTMRTGEAIELAESRGLNLVEVAAKSSPPVCRIMDYGKYRYDQKKKKQKQNVVQLKEMKFRPRISNHDFDFKVRKVKQFIENGHRVKCTIMFRGREMEHTEIGRELLERVIERVGDVAIEQAIKLEGYDMTVRLMKRTN